MVGLIVRDLNGNTLYRAEDVLPPVDVDAPAEVHLNEAAEYLIVTVAVEEVGDDVE